MAGRHFRVSLFSDELKENKLMRPFEITLIIVLFAFLLNCVINKNHNYFWYWLIVVAVAALLQIFIEGVRWQMFPAFI